jgi:hypothetical protein
MFSSDENKDKDAQYFFTDMLSLEGSEWLMSVL